MKEIGLTPEDTPDEKSYTIRSRTKHPLHTYKKTTHNTNIFNTKKDTKVRIYEKALGGLQSMIYTIIEETWLLNWLIWS